MEDIKVDLGALWPNEPLLGRAQIRKAIANIVFVYASLHATVSYVSGMCEMAAVILVVMQEGKVDADRDAEADAFWCFTELMAEIQDSFVTDTGICAVVEGLSSILRKYDPEVARRLEKADLTTFLALKWCAALCTQMSLSLPILVDVWDRLLADPERFSMAFYFCVAVILLCREDLLKYNDFDSLTEGLFAYPAKVDGEVLIAAASAICAFERRRSEPLFPQSENGNSPWLARTLRAALEEVTQAPAEESLEAAQASLHAASQTAKTQMTSLWT